MPAKTIPVGWTKGEHLEVITLPEREGCPSRWLLQQLPDEYFPGDEHDVINTVAYVIFYDQQELVEWLEWWKS